MARLTPVHLRLFAIGQSFFYQFGEHPLLPAVIFRLAGSKLTAPVIRETELLQLTTHLIDVVIGPLSRRTLVFDRRILSRKTECIPANRV